MSNDYYEHPDTFIPGDLARAEDVENEFRGVQAGFQKLPTPRPSGDGFLTPFYIAEATEDGHAATRGQLTSLEASALAHKEAAASAQTGAEAAQTGAQTAETNAQSHAGTALTHATTASGHATTAGTEAGNAAASALLASQWATKIDAPVSGSDYGARYYSNLSKTWATGTGEIEPGLKSAKVYAEEAKATVAGARTYIGQHDASGGNYPIATPVSGDEGKYWVISVAGTLPLGAVDVGWELSINSSLAYEAANLLPANLVSEVNGISGPTVTLTQADIPSIGTTYVAQANYTAADVLAKLVTVDGAGSNLDADRLDGQHGSYYLAAASYTASDVLTKIKTVDGSSSGLDADLLDGIQGSSYLRGDLNNAVVPLTISRFTSSATTALVNNGDVIWNSTDGLYNRRGAVNYKLWDSGNDGAGSGLDADTLDGLQASAFAQGDNFSVTGTYVGLRAQATTKVDVGLGNVPNATTSSRDDSSTATLLLARGMYDHKRSADHDGRYYTQTQCNDNFLNSASNLSDLSNPVTARANLGVYGTTDVYTRSESDGRYLNEASNLSDLDNIATARANLGLGTAATHNEGSGNGLDADLLDGLQGSSYLTKGEFDPAAATLVWSGSAAYVNMTALSEQGAGLYVLVYDGDRYMVFIQDAAADACGGAIGASLGAVDDLQVRYASYVGAVFMVQSASVKQSHNQTLTITAIYKA